MRADDLARAKAFEAEIDIAGIVEGRGQGDRLYALTGMKTADESARGIVEGIIKKSEAAAQICGDAVLNYDRASRGAKFDLLKRVDLSSCVTFGKNILKLEVAETTESSPGGVFGIACPVPDGKKLKPREPKVDGSR